MKSHFLMDQSVLDRVRPLVEQHSEEIQPYGTITKLPITLAEHVCKVSVEDLNQLLADTMTLRDIYKKHHWQVAGPTFTSASQVTAGMTRVETEEAVPFNTTLSISEITGPDYGR